MKKCHYLKIRSISNEFLNSETDISDKVVDGLLDAFRTQISNNDATNSILKRHHQATQSQNGGSGSSKDDNISLSSDEQQQSDDSDEPLIKSRRRHHLKYAIDSDSDIEIIDSDDIGRASAAGNNDRKLRSGPSKENIDISRHSAAASARYDFRSRKNFGKTGDGGGSDRLTSGTNARLRFAGGGGAGGMPQGPDTSEIIQIEDSSDEDVQEIRRDAGNGFNG